MKYKILYETNIGFNTMERIFEREPTVTEIEFELDRIRRTDGVKFVKLINYKKLID